MKQQNYRFGMSAPARRSDLNRPRNVLFFLTLIGLNAICYPSLAQNAQRQSPDTLFNRWDKNGDKKLVREELPKPLQGNFDRVDSNRDGEISLKEHSEFLARRKTQPPKRNQNQHVTRKPRVPDGTTVLQDLEYVDSGHERQKLDIFLPAAATKESRIPLVIWVHGGGWKNGSKNNPRGVQQLLQQGFAVASINYRLSEHATFPAQIHDCKAAVRFLRKNASRHGIDPEKFGVWGSSAGGHLVALLGTSGDVDELEGSLGVTGVSSRVQAVCDWFGPSDLLKMNEQAGEKGAVDHDAADSPESKLIGGAIQDHQQKTRKANPVTYVSSDDPPFLIMHGDQDRLVPVQQSELLDELLDKAGVSSELKIIEGAGHGFRETKHIERVVEFFSSKLLKTNEHQ